MNTTLEQVKLMLNQYVQEVVQRVREIFPQVSAAAIEPLVREQLENVIVDSLDRKMSEIFPK